MSRELKKIEKLYVRLMEQPAHVFPRSGEPLQAPPEQGVYVILDPKDCPAHVGRTLRGKKGLFQRLNNHLHAQSSFALHHLDSDGSKLRGKYRFRFLKVADPRERALLEAYAIARLCPAHLGLGEDAAQ